MGMASLAWSRRIIARLRRRFFFMTSDARGGGSLGRMEHLTETEGTLPPRFAPAATSAEFAEGVDDAEFAARLAAAGWDDGEVRWQPRGAVTDGVARRRSRQR